VNVRSNALLGMWFSLAAIAMLFIGLTSAYVVRRGLDQQWSPVAVPHAALPACACLLASSVTLELYRRSGRREWLLITGVLGIAFVAGQLAACRELAAAGLYLSTNPHSSFVYLFTALHGVHVVGGVLALAFAARTDVIALYWHAMSVLWTYLLAVLFVW
jgi:cytochrome c oxidase subunit III